LPTRPKPCSILFVLIHLMLSHRFNVPFGNLSWNQNLIVNNWTLSLFNA